MPPDALDAYASSLTPYPGLRPFSEKDGFYFFGREQQISDLLVRLKRTRFVPIIGLSGSGKSSLVLAGLLPVLRNGFLVEAGDRWRLVTMRPGSPNANPFQNLAESFVLSLSKDENIRFDMSAQVELMKMLRSGSSGLVYALQRYKLPDKTNLLLVVDQFEEIFRFRQVIDPIAAELFVRLLLASADQDGVPIYVVLTMRSDYLGECALFHDLPEAINKSHYLVPRLTDSQLEDAIVKPARVVGGDVQTSLVPRLLGELDGDSDDLPVLQHALMRMWENKTRHIESGLHSKVVLTLDDYVDLKTRLDEHAEKIYADLGGKKATPNDKLRLQAATRLIFRRLTERAGRKEQDTRVPTSLKNLCRIAHASKHKASEEDVKLVIEAFRSEGNWLLTPIPPQPLQDETTIDISHECLIRRWSRLGKWVQEEVDDARDYQRLIEYAQQWARVFEPKGLASGSRLFPMRARVASWLNLLPMRLVSYFLSWKKNADPTEEWAERYGRKEDWELQQKFLVRSHIQRNIIWGGGGLLIILLVGFGFRQWVSDKAMTASLLVLSEKKQSDALERGLTAVNWGKWSKWRWSASAGERSLRDVLLQFPSDVKLPGNISQDDKGFSASLQSGRTVLIDPGKKSLTIRLKDGKEHVTCYVKKNDILVGAILSPDGRWLAAATGRLDDKQDVVKNQIVVFDSDSKECIKKDDLDLMSGPLGRPAFAFDGKSELLIASMNGKIKIWSTKRFPRNRNESERARESLPADVDKWALVGEPPERQVVTSIAVSSDADKKVVVLTGLNRGAMVSFSGDWGSTWYSTSLPHKSPVAVVALSGNGRVALTGDDTGSANIWKLEQPKSLTGEPYPVRVSHQAPIRAATFSKDGRLVLTASDDDSVIMWHSDDGDEVFRMNSEFTGVSQVLMSDDLSTVMTASDDGTVRHFDLREVKWFPDINKVPQDLREESFRNTFFSTNGQYIATRTTEATVDVFDNFEQTKPKRILQDFKAKRRAMISLSDDGRWVGGPCGQPYEQTSAEGGLACIYYEEKPVQLPRTFPKKGVEQLVVSPTGEDLLIAGRQAIPAQIWQLLDGKIFGNAPKVVLEDRSQPDAKDGQVIDAVHVAISPSEPNLIVIGRSDGEVSGWNKSTGKKIWPSKKSRDPLVTAIAFGNKAKLVATGHQNGSVWVRNAISGEKLHQLGGPFRAAIESVSFSSDGSFLLATNRAGAIMLWSLQTLSEGEVPTIVKGINWNVEAAAFRELRNKLFIAVVYRDGSVYARECNICVPTSSLVALAKARLKTMREKR